MTDKEEIAALRREVDALKTALSGKEDKPEPKKEFVPQPYEPIDWTARMTMPPSALRAMVAAEPKGFMSGVVRDNRAPTSPSTIPSSQQSRDVRGPGSGTGWAAERPLGPQPGIDLIDRAVNSALPHGPEWGKK
jgi:hypothetical protein